VSEQILFRAVGDIGPNRPDPEQCFDLARAYLAEADLTFAQLECNITARGERLPQVRHTHRAVPQAASAIVGAGLDVISFASNHCMDWGIQGFNDTIRSLEDAGASVVGVGANIEEARKPIVRLIGDVRVAFIAACSILPADYWAEKSRPGCVPLRAHTIYDQIEPDQPGTPARILTFPYSDDLAKLEEDVRQARELADVVVVSLHWGIHFIPAVLADYQRMAGQRLIDAGADLILGHHAHILKGVELYKGKAIFYSLGNFAVDLPITPEHAKSKGFKEVQALSPGWEPDFESLYNFPPDSRMSVSVEARLGRTGVNEIAFKPFYINSNAQPEPLESTDDRFGQVVTYMHDCCEAENLNTRFSIREDRVVLE
jgi:poly-gamma-glutamate synthesis protein (capsule biosynthesis protein)